MRIRVKNHGKSGSFSRRCDDPLKLAVRLALSQLSQGIGVAEAVQFAAKYHNVTCVSIEAELSKRRAFPLAD
jgi:hypothetical protein